MKALVEKKMEAIKMRQSGMKQPDIVSELCVSKGIVSMWLKGIDVPKDYYEKIYTNRYGHKQGVICVGDRIYISCNKCKKSKMVEEFLRKNNSSNSNERSAYESSCIECNSKRVANHNKRNKIKVIDMLGGRCSCGCEEESMLEIHHINGDGKKERQKMSKEMMRRKILKMPKYEALKIYKLVCEVCHEAEHVKMKHSNISYEIKFIKI